MESQGQGSTGSSHVAVGQFISGSTSLGVSIQPDPAYFQELSGLIEKQKRYPPAARRLKQSGAVEVSFYLKKDGTFERLTLTRPSAFQILNEAALDLIRSIGRFPVPPQGVGNEGLEIKVPVIYELR